MTSKRIRKLRETLESPTNNQVAWCYAWLAMVLVINHWAALSLSGRWTFWLLVPWTEIGSLLCFARGTTFARRPKYQRAR
jgi:hypothetical protein